MTTGFDTTRRTLFALGLALTAPAPLAFAKSSKETPEDTFIQSIAGLHPNGRRVAEAAIAAGMKPEWLSNVILYGALDSGSNHRPNLMFALPGEGCRYQTFSPENPS